MNINNIHPSWKSFFDSQIELAYFDSLVSKIDNARSSTTVYPPEDMVFSAFKLTPLTEIKIVILGQDPYYNEGQAHGLAFSVQHGVALPPSLKNIFTELKNSVDNFKIPSHGCLESWAKQGVMLLNDVLTVEQGKPNSHKNWGWEIFTTNAISQINFSCQNVVFLLWGGNAKTKSKLIDKSKHLILESPHPSPLSAYRGFFGCNHFTKANNYLISHGMSPILWELK
ncbi:uracil-DNA glycosylase [Taylorella equigenitalis]|uniref:uracil-DNA glycosylase n=1 Tax=Taylorella equigenitalis TaxID=29575 RepID=UPI00042895AE|nr:uracil-DNA glycosylase [Taylorella equigenitalis]ASY37919.1 uracil-DNA glycosylase [Taylorella equigenitalis]ASY42340.1 uracil-DNA glycosylase [Taylorella equigenitalis]KGK32940.1 uracil-DNA glycosylase [Taylorella equigenitalis]RBA26018.1 uracil-DNA glycosylase [Taylorella equigenitalis]